MRQVLGLLSKNNLGVLFGILVAAEIAYSRLFKKDFIEWKDFRANWIVHGCSLVVTQLWNPLGLALYTFVFNAAPFHLGYKNFALVFVCATLADDLCFYIFHRYHHKVPLLWACHVTHHSSKQYNLSVGFRDSWTPFFGIFFWLPLALVGLDPVLFMALRFNHVAYQGLLHTQVVRKLGPLEWIFNTPSHHRVHHGTEPEYLNKNFGGMFIIWDRLFGTFQEEHKTPTFGLAKNIESYNPFVIAFHEWAALLKRWKARFSFVSASPVK